MLDQSCDSGFAQQTHTEKATNEVELESRDRDIGVGKVRKDRRIKERQIYKSKSSERWDVRL